MSGKSPKDDPKQNDELPASDAEMVEAERRKAGRDVPPLPGDEKSATAREVARPRKPTRGEREAERHERDHND